MQEFWHENSFKFMQITSNLLELFAFWQIKVHDACTGTIDIVIPS